MSGKYFILKCIDILLLIIIFTSTTHSRNWVVYPDETGDAPTIQAAVNFSSAGDTISVMAGVYVQQIINCTKESITIIGIEGAENTILQNNDYPPWILNIGEYFHAHNNFKVQGLTFKGCEHAIWVKWFGFVTIEACIFRGNGTFNILFENSHHVEIKHNLIYGNGNGIMIYDSSNYTIINNTIAYNSGCGIDIGGNGEGSIINNLITNNSYGVYNYDHTIALLCNNAYDNNIDYFLYDMPDPTGMNGNISIHPEYCSINPSITGNFYLQSDSPCLPNNHPDGFECGVIGLYSAGCGPTAVEETSWGKIKSIFK